ncbi:GAF domain-containing protein [Nocardia sp. CDC153]|uniref:GAF domain-containing protein n=1 Tax=Nocardia sp. CDC153 TaxID=3112167 RepID=UPI002DB775F1|nr:GAF domain-containing protein [Nocardia sp. CDC153]MEC3952925.1 GAF domain-containing protein [Nocardia sp. CDC153]
MAKQGWTLVETLGPDGPSVIAREHEPRARTSFDRTVTDLVGAGKAPGAEAARRVRVLLAELRERPGPRSASISLRSGQHLTARMLPVIGPDATLHGVHLWLSPTPAPPSATPLSAFGFGWDARQRIAEIPPALAAGTPRTRLTAPEVFRFLEPSPADALSLFETLLSQRPGAHWDGDVVVAAHGRQVPARLVMTAGPTAEDAHRWRGMLFETPGAEGIRTDSLEAAALAAIPRMTSVHLAVFDVAKMRMLRWITDPMTDVQWKGQVDQRDTPHPDDVKRIFAAAEGIFTGRVEVSTVPGIRLRRKGGGWVVVDCTGSLMRTPPGSPQLLLVQFHVTGYSHEPDPVEPSDLGHPGLDDPRYPRYPLK